MISRKEQAESFRALHQEKRLFVLPKAWDVASARIFENAGFPAVATSSAGMMVSLGYPDGELIPREEFLATVRRISKVLSIPLSVDIVSGFATADHELATTIEGVTNAGGIGINIEDFAHSTKKLETVER